MHLRRGEPPRPAAFALRRAGRAAAALALIAACGIGPAPSPVKLAILGKAPSYGPAATGDVPNRVAIDRLIWMPGLDDGWDPQGLAFARGSLLVSAYLSRSMWRDRGPCRVFRIDPATGSETGHFDIPAPCGHAGGLAHAGGTLFIADTHTLFEVNLDQAFGQRCPTMTVHPLGPGLKGAFAVSDDGAIWIGDYRQNGQARAFKFPLTAIDRLADGATLNIDMAAASVPVPTYGQGGALDSAGDLWIARSDIGWGFLDKVDRTTGKLLQRCPAPAGIEGIAFDKSGRLWAVSEAGARHLPWRYPFFPLIFRLDPARLRAFE